MAPATQRCAVLVPQAFRSIVERLCSFILTYGGSGAPSSSFISLYLLIRYDALHVSDDPLLFTPPVMGGNVLSRPFTILIIHKIHHSHHSVPLLRISSSPVSQHLSVLVSCTAQRIEKDLKNALTSSSDAWIRAGVFQGIAFGTDELVHCPTLPWFVPASPTARAVLGLGTRRYPHTCSVPSSRNTFDVAHMRPLTPPRVYRRPNARTPGESRVSHYATHTPLLVCRSGARSVICTSGRYGPRRKVPIVNTCTTT